MADVLQFRQRPGASPFVRAEITRHARSRGDRLCIVLRRRPSRQNENGDTRFVGEVDITEKQLAWQMVARASDEAGIRCVWIGPGVQYDGSSESFYIRRNRAAPSGGGSAA